MGTQVSKTEGLLDRAIQQREVTRELRRKKSENVAAESETKRANRAQAVAESREKREVSGARDVNRYEAAEAYRTNINEKQRIQEMAEDSVSPGEAVREMYGLNDPLQLLAKNNARNDDLRREREISISKQKATIKAASAEREKTNAQYEAGNAKDLEDNLRRQMEKIRDLERDLNLAEERKDKEALAELSGDSGKTDEARVMLEDIEADLVKMQKAMEINDKSQAKVAARDVAQGEKQLKKALAGKQFQQRQIQANKPKDTTDGAFEEVAVAPNGEPDTTLGLVASKEEGTETKADRKAKRVEESGPAEAIFVTPEDVRMDTAEELQETRAKVAEALEKTRALSSEVNELDKVTKKVVKKVMESIDASVPGERLPGPEQAARAAEEAARITIDDPMRALQSQALISVDTAMRVLR